MADGPPEDKSGSGHQENFASLWRLRRWHSNYFYKFRWYSEFHNVLFDMKPAAKKLNQGFGKGSAKGSRGITILAPS